MSLWDRVMQSMALAPWDHQPKELSTEPGPPSPTEAQLMQQRIQRQQELRPWRPGSIRDALGVPAIFQAVNLIANLAGTFTLQAYRKGVLVPDDERPPLIVRPNPFTTLRDFLRETAFSMATHGESWWWTAARDSDGRALSLIPVPVREVKVEGSDWLKPTILWRNKPKTPDMTQLVLMRELGATRGRGPLQLCGAAISAAVESQEWAANFYADGGNPNIHLHSEVELTADEATALRSAWVNTPPNMPQVTSGPVAVDTVSSVNEGSAQMLDSRNFNAGEAARMFSIPGPLLEFSRGGSSLTYTNIATLMDQLVRQCLLPNYLEPMEQALSDLLPRDWTARFNVDSILRADVKTRYDVYKTGIDSGVLSVEQAQQMEGLIPGSVENAPVPYAPPSAVPAGLPAPTLMSNGEWRCDSCGKKLAETRGSGTQLRCRCGALAVA